MARLDLPCERARLVGMTIGSSARVYEEIVGKPTRSRHKQYLIHRILWRVQARVEGDLSERANGSARCRQATGTRSSTRPAAIGRGSWAYPRTRTLMSSRRSSRW